MELIYATGKLEENYRILRNQRRRETSNILVFKMDGLRESINMAKSDTSMIGQLQERIYLKTICGKNGICYLVCNAYDVFDYINEESYGPTKQRGRLSTADSIEYARRLMSAITSCNYRNACRNTTEVADSLLTSQEWLEKPTYPKEWIHGIFHDNIEDIKNNVTSSSVLLRSNSIDEEGLITSNCEIYHRFKTREGLGSTFANRLINLSFRITMCASSLIMMHRYLMDNGLTIQAIDSLETLPGFDGILYEPAVPEYYIVDIVGCVEDYVRLIKQTPRSKRFGDNLFLDQLEEIISSYRIIY